MRLHSWVCPDCDAYFSAVEGCREGSGSLTVKYPDCGEVERIRKRQEVVPNHV
jgi:hypothetical protein